MNNDDWISTLEKVPPEQRAVFDAMRGHYDDVHISELHAFLTMLTRIEEKQDAAALDRSQVTVFLERLVLEVGVIGNGLTAHIREFREWRADVDARFTHDRGRIDTLDGRVNVLESRVTALEARLAGAA